MRYRVSYFLSWTADRGLSRRLTVPAVPSQQPADFLDDDQRWQLLQRCLADSTMPVGVRAAGALVLLFGLQLQRIRHLTAGQITEKDGNAYLTVGRRPVFSRPASGRSSASWPYSRLPAS